MSVLDYFPKKRPALPDDIAKIYKQQYKENREGETTASSLSQKLESWIHKKVAEDLEHSDSPKTTLEIGAGTLNQLQYEAGAMAYDIIEPFKELFEGSPLLDRVRATYCDISEIADNQKYDRITAIASFEHICNLPEVISRCGVLLGKEGVLRVSIPSEGTFLWTLGWKMTTGLEFRLKYGLDYGKLMKHEHVNTAAEIEALLKWFFHDVKSSVFGICKRISLYQFYECKNADLDKCREYLDSMAVDP